MSRSTRNKIRFQVHKAAAQQDRAIDHLAYAESLAEGRSDVLTEHLVNLAAVLQGCKQLLLQFRDEL